MSFAPRECGAGVRLHLPHLIHICFQQRTKQDSTVIPAVSTDSSAPLPIMSNESHSSLPHEDTTHRFCMHLVSAVIYRTSQLNLLADWLSSLSDPFTLSPNGDDILCGPSHFITRGLIIVTPKKIMLVFEKMWENARIFSIKKATFCHENIFTDQLISE